MELIAEKRDITGKKVKKLRYAGLVPAVLFGNKLESENISVPGIPFAKLYAEAGDTSLIDLKIDNKSHKVLVNEIQYDPISLKVNHIGFYKPNLKEKTKVNVPVILINEDQNALLKNGEAMLLTIVDEIEVEALPMDLPHNFTIDANDPRLQSIGSSIKVSDLDYDKDKVEIMGLEAEDPIVKLDNPNTQEEVEEKTPEELEKEAIAAMEATSEKKPEEDDATETENN